MLGNSASDRPLKRKRERGAIMVEATLTVPLYIILAIVLVDLCRITFFKVSVQYVANELIREAVTVCDLENTSDASTCPLNDPLSPAGPDGCNPRSSAPGGYLTNNDLDCYGLARADRLRQNGANLLNTFALGVDPSQIKICREPDGCSGETIHAGLPDDLISISVEKPFQPIIMMLGLPGSINLGIKVIGKNESYYGD